MSYFAQGYVAKYTVLIPLDRHEYPGVPVDIDKFQPSLSVEASTVLFDKYMEEQYRSTLSCVIDRDRKTLLPIRYVRSLLCQCVEDEQTHVQQD